VANILQQPAAKTIIALAPMDGVTDFAFRSMVKKYGQPDLLFTEFVSAEGLCRGAAENLIGHLDYEPNQQPIIAQLFGKTPEDFYTASLLVAELGFAGVDLNMGCPARTVAQSGSGAALIAQPELAQAILRSSQRAMQDWVNGQTLANLEGVNPKLIRALARQRELWSLTPPERKPLAVSVKTRIGTNDNELKTWLPYLIALAPNTITLHGRTLKQGYSGQADWSAIAEARALIKSANPAINFFANGDVQNYEEAMARAATYQTDGILIGRASFGNPFVFLPAAKRQALGTWQHFLALAIDHAQLFEEHNIKAGHDKFFSMRKHLAWYVKNMPGAAALRAQLVLSNSAAEVAEIIQAYLQELKEKGIDG